MNTTIIEKQPNKTNKILVAFLVVGLLLAIIIGGYFIYRSFRKTVPTPLTPAWTPYGPTHPLVPQTPALTPYDPSNPVNPLAQQNQNQTYTFTGPDLWTR